MKHNLTPICLVLVLITFCMPWIARLLDQDESHYRRSRAAEKVERLRKGPDAFVGEWKVKVRPDDEARKAGEKPFDDTLIFTKGGTFESVACRDYGFKVVEYQVDSRGQTIATFVADAESETEGKAKWTGVVSADAIKGEMVWTKKDGSTFSYTWEGGH